jgi:predicted CopG family antitoxin
MAVKTITIDMDAYGILASAKQGSESFSRVIKRRFSKPTTGRNLLSHLDEVCLSPSGLKGVEIVLKGRSESLAKSPAL